jgi:hypothetical protein
VNGVSPRAEQVAYEAVRDAQALKDCEEYLFTTGVHSYSGRAFGIGYAKTPNAISIADLEALKLLKVARNIEVRRQAAAFAGLPQVAELLSVMPDTPVREMPDYIHHSTAHPQGDAGCCKWGPADCLWYEVAKVKQFGSFVVRSKLLARKRPNLIPIYDAFVGGALGIGTIRHLDYSMWGTMQLVTQSERVWVTVTAIHESLRANHAESPFLEGLTPLRTLDIILWMKFRR